MGHRTFLYGLAATAVVAPLATWGIRQAPALIEDPGIGPIAAKISTSPLVDAVTMMTDGATVDTHAITDALHLLHRFVRDIAHDESFSQFTLTWPGDNSLQLYVHTEREGGSSGPWFHADSYGPTNNSGQSGTELLFVEPTRRMQVSVVGLDLLGGLDPRNIVGVDNLNPAAIDGSPRNLVNTTATLFLNAIQAAFIDGIEQIGEVIQLVAYRSSIAGAPNVVGRAAWGTDESIRSGSSSYSTFKGTYIHHTAGSNNYSESQGPVIVHGTYTYHVKTLGWGDIGYNALVDKYGSIYEGRYGGLDKNIEGTHAGGSDNGTSGISVMGNHGQLEIPDAAVTTLGEMVGRRMRVGGVGPMSTATLTSTGYSKARCSFGQTVNLPAIFSHRGTGYTSCLGNFGCQQMDTTRATAKAKFDGAGGADIAGRSTNPDNQDREAASIPPIPGAGESGDNGDSLGNVETPTPGKVVGEFLADSLPANPAEATRAWFTPQN